MEFAPKFDVREDEEQFERLQDCIDLLIAAGYFRARVKGITAFDKIVGGIVWCISTCNLSVDVDLLYAENSTIGQKISLTEKIVGVLPRLQCPHTIEPHQIQGLDFIHIFPVIQWLVKRAIEAKELYGDRNQAFVDYLHSRGTAEGTSQQSSDHKVENPVLDLKRGVVRTRTFRRGRDAHFDDIRDDVLCTLAEYATPDGIIVADYRDDSRERKIEPVAENLRVAAGRSKATGKAMRTLIDETDIDRLTSITQARTQKRGVESEEELDAELADLAAELVQLQKEFRVEEDKLQSLQAEHEQLETRCREADELEENFEPSQLEQLRHIFDEYVHAAERESAFKLQCKRQLEEIETEIERLEGAGAEDESEDLRLAKADLSNAEEELRFTRIQAAERTQQIARLQRAVDSVPSQIELAQYHKRLIELYNQMGSKHRQTRQYYVLHNSLVDVRNYMKKEIELLNSIEEVLPLAKKEENRDSFIEQLLKIHRGIESNLEKLQIREHELDAKKEILNVELTFIRDKERTFQKALDDFKKECEHVNILKLRLCDLGYVDDE